MGSYAGLLPLKPITCKSKCICNYLKCRYLPLLLFIHHITVFLEKPFVRCVALNFSTARRLHQEGAAVPLFGGAEVWEVGAPLLFPRRSELLGRQG